MSQQNWTWTCRHCAFQGEPKHLRQPSVVGVVAAIAIVVLMPAPVYYGSTIVLGEQDQHVATIMAIVTALGFAAAVFTTYRRWVTVCPRCGTPAGST